MSSIVTAGCAEARDSTVLIATDINDINATDVHNIKLTRSAAEAAMSSIAIARCAEPRGSTDA